MNILQLDFCISNFYGTKDLPLGAWKDGHHGETDDTLYSAADVSKIVNAKIKELSSSAEIVDVKIDFVTVHCHNNGGANTVMEYVTILYK